MIFFTLLDNSPFVTKLVFELIGTWVGLSLEGGLELRVRGPGLDNNLDGKKFMSQLLK